MESERNSSPSKGKDIKSQDRWPDRSGWEVLAQTVEALAAACDGKAQCHKKNDYLSVSLETRNMPIEQYQALYTLAELIEQVSDTEDHGEQSSIHWIRSILAGMQFSETKR